MCEKAYGNLLNMWESITLQSDKENAVDNVHPVIYLDV